MQAVFPQVAEYLGFQPLTTCYTSEEHALLLRAVAQIKEGGGKFLLVARARGIEIWTPKPATETQNNKQAHDQNKK